eukprot:4155394-Pyramimonas_sp.AAC.1
MPSTCVPRIEMRPRTFRTPARPTAARSSGARRTALSRHGVQSRVELTCAREVNFSNEETPRL